MINGTYVKCIKSQIIPNKYTDNYYELDVSITK
jgi:hypothetical protein